MLSVLTENGNISSRGKLIYVWGMYRIMLDYESLLLEEQSRQLISPNGINERYSDWRGFLTVKWSCILNLSKACHFFLFPTRHSEGPSSTNPLKHLFCIVTFSPNCNWTVSDTQNFLTKYALKNHLELLQLPPLLADLSWHSNAVCIVICRAISREG